MPFPLLELHLKPICTRMDVQMIGDESGVVLKDTSSGSGMGATWAFEAGGQTMVCPILVEDLNPPGQMLVEVKSLCIHPGIPNFCVVFQLTSLMNEEFSNI